MERWVVCSDSKGNVIHVNMALVRTLRRDKKDELTHVKFDEEHTDYVVQTIGDLIGSGGNRSKK